MTADEVFARRGWIVVELQDPSVVDEIGDQLLASLRAGPAPRLTRLDDYHEHVSDAAHEQVHWELAQHFWDAQLGRRIAASELGFLREFVGLDLHVQRYPYLRIARPGCARDVTGLHRDLDYGASPFEVSIVVPFTEVGDDAALRVVSGSHTEPSGAFPATRVESTDVTPGSRRHQLGFPYAPQVLSPEVAASAEPVPLHVGQALIVSLGLVHGQDANRSTNTRISTDLRVVNSLAPVSFSRGVREDYYEPLSSSPVTEQARRQLERDA